MFSMTVTNQQLLIPFLTCVPLERENRDYKLNNERLRNIPSRNLKFISKAARGGHWRVLGLLYRGSKTGPTPVNEGCTGSGVERTMRFGGQSTTGLDKGKDIIFLALADWMVIMPFCPNPLEAGSKGPLWDTTTLKIREAHRPMINKKSRILNYRGLVKANNSPFPIL